MPDDLDQKRNHTMYLSNECIQKADELAAEWGIPRNAVIEYSVRAVHEARSALTYEIARQNAAKEHRQELDT